MTAPVTAERAPRSRRRSAWAWTAIGAVLVATGAVGAMLAASAEWAQKQLFDPDGAGPDGARALVQLLRQQGVEVEVARSLDSAERALGADTTLVLRSSAVFSDDAVLDLVGRAGDVVLIDPSSRDIRLLFDGGTRVGIAPAALVAPDCAQPDAARAGSVVPGALFASEGASVVGCYPVDDGFGLLVSDRTPTARVAALDARGILTNEHLAADGNAALALGLAGRNAKLVWYMPSPLDSDLGASAPSLADLTPPWVTPALVMLLCGAVVAGVWRGRRFGPLVAEKLPVTVRASETMQGRARLYARSRDAAHALDALRLGAVDRIARLLGLGPS
ncbi:MAG: DUF4350 domain-containing protein, partial [Microbacterium sp.]|uniref:DUF4350 domain-containing protein n=1 Tax=Microbacterium sp. TaxID=51671 RepID=UPI0039E2FF6A